MVNLLDIPETDLTFRDVGINFQRKETRMRIYRIILSLAVAATLILGVSLVGAQPTQPYPIGEVKIEATQVSAGIGYTWGGGKLKFKGKEYSFAVKGLNVAAVGMVKINAKGDVYNMENVADFAGKYMAVEGGAALVKGKAGLIMRNTKGVVINLTSDQTGVQLTLGPEGFSIEMK